MSSFLNIIWHVSGQQQFPGHFLFFIAALPQECIHRSNFSVHSQNFFISVRVYESVSWYLQVATRYSKSPEREAQETFLVITSRTDTKYMGCWEGRSGRLGQVMVGKSRSSDPTNSPRWTFHSDSLVKRWFLMGLPNFSPRGMRESNAGTKRRIVVVLK
ncbi:hypothetical protein BDC45DRAFT_531322 [Circinella umbellata]|nr:hypothetical protein BDC45DRAFT_531322 [Circinella umbellata]